MTKKAKFRVTNRYGIAGESHHHTPAAALREARKREGEGWQVLDQDGNEWWDDGWSGVPYIIHYSHKGEQEGGA